MNAEIATPTPTRWLARPKSCWAQLSHTKRKTAQHTHELLPLLYFIVELSFFSFTSNILNGRGDIAHKYHKSTTYYFHWKLIFYIRYDWIGMKWCRIRRHNTTHSCRLTQTPFRTRERRGVLLGWAQTTSFQGQKEKPLRAVLERAAQPWCLISMVPALGELQTSAEKLFFSPSFSVFDAAF